MRGTWAFVGALALAGCWTAGERPCEAGCPLDANPGETGSPDGGASACLSIALPAPGSAPQILPVFLPLKGGVWRTQSGLHVVWGERLATDSSGVGPTVLALASFDPSTGALRGRRTYDLFPANATGISINGAAGLEDGTFAVGYGWTGGDSPSWGKLMIGNADDPGRRLDVDLRRSTEWRGLTDVTWDGEAFAVHAWVDRVSQELLVARVSVTGQLLLPLTSYGKSGQGGFAEPEEKAGGYTVATSATSGRSFHFDPRSLRLLNGHDRGGAPLPWTPRLIDLPGGEVGGDFAGSRADDQGGVWLAWQDHNDAATEYVGRAAHLSGAGHVETSFSFSSPGDDPYSTPSPIKTRPALLARGPTGVRIFATTWYRIYVFDHDGRDLSAPRVLFQDRAAYQMTSCYLLVWNMGPIAWHDEEWLSFVEQRGGNTRVLRVVRVKDGCQYGSISPLPEPTCR